MTQTVGTFKDAYAVLQRNAQTLRNEQEPNIDNLLGIVTESVAAYKVCQERIAAVEQALEKALGEAGVDGLATAQPAHAEHAAPTLSAGTGFDGDTDEVPF